MGNFLAYLRESIPFRIVPAAITTAALAHPAHQLRQPSIS